MRIVSFNVNSIRARAHQLAALCTHYSPDIIGLQETKVQDSEFPQDMVAELGYQAVFHGQKGHYGVAILSKQAACSVSTGFPGESADAQRRLIRAEYPGPQGRRITVINGYFPQGEQREHATKFPHKRSFYADLHQLLSDLVFIDIYHYCNNTQRELHSLVAMAYNSELSKIFLELVSNLK